MTVVFLCPICNAPNQTCGDDHMTKPPITSDTIKGEKRE